MRAVCEQVENRRPTGGVFSVRMLWKRIFKGCNNSTLLTKRGLTSIHDDMIDIDKPLNYLLKVVLSETIRLTGTKIYLLGAELEAQNKIT